MDGESSGFDAFKVTSKGVEQSVSLVPEDGWLEDVATAGVLFKHSSVDVHIGVFWNRKNKPHGLILSQQL